MLQITLVKFCYQCIILGALKQVDHVIQLNLSQLFINVKRLLLLTLVIMA